MVSQLIANLRLSRRLAIGAFVIDLLVMLLLGPACFLIAHGFTSGWIRLAPFWEPANKLLRRVAGSEEVLPSLKLYGHLNWMIFLGRAVASLFMIAFGIALLIKPGFLALNPIYLLFFYSSPTR